MRHGCKKLLVGHSTLLRLSYRPRAPITSHHAVILQQRQVHGEAGNVAAGESDWKDATTPGHRPRHAQAAGVLKVTLEKNTGGTPGTLDALLTEAALKTLVVTVSKAHGVVVDPKNIVVSP